MISISQQPKRTELLEDLEQEILMIYRSVSGQILEVPSSNKSQRQELLLEARDLCSRLESMLSIINDEQESPELEENELEELTHDLVTEARNIHAKLRNILSQIHSIDR